MWDQRLLEGEGPLYRRIYYAIARMIREGVLKPGVPLPSPRVLASQLGVSRNSIAQAYELLAVEGLVQVEPRKGFFVSSLGLAPKAFSSWPEASGWKSEEKLSPGQQERSVLGPSKDEELWGPLPGPPRDRWLVYDFWPGCTDPRLFPWKKWREVLNRLLYTGTRRFFTAYAPPQGIPSLREAVAGYLGAVRGILIDPEEVLITNGSQEAIHILAQLFQVRGRLVVVEDPCYRGAYAALRVCGAKLYPVPVDGGGLILDGLPKDGCLIYVTPSHQYPTGVVMDQERRYELIAWAHAQGAYILEDDYDSEFWYEGLPPPALRSLDEDRVIYLGTFSKVLGPGIRLGYAVLPRRMINAAVAVKAALNVCSPPFIQAILADFIASGILQRHLYRVRRTYYIRRTALLRALRSQLGHLRVQGQQGGLHLAVWLPRTFPSVRELKPLLEARGVGVYGLLEANAWASEKLRSLYSRVLFLGFASLNEQEIQAGVKVLGGILSLKR